MDHGGSCSPLKGFESSKELKCLHLHRSPWLSLLRIDHRKEESDKRSREKTIAVMQNYFLAFALEISFKNSYYKIFSEILYRSKKKIA